MDVKLGVEIARRVAGKLSVLFMGRHCCGS